MFIFDIPEIKYVSPWKVSLDKRLETLFAGERRAAYFYEYPDSSTFRYRVYNMVQALLGANKNISATYFFKDEISYLDKIIQDIDVLVISRSRYTAQLNHLITNARNRGKKVFFDIDDLVFDIDFVHFFLNAVDKDIQGDEVWDCWFAYVGRIGALLKLCDVVITTNEYLAGRIRKFTQKPVNVIPNFLNQEQLQISERMFTAKKKQNFLRNDQIHLGYFSGSTSHNKDFEVITDALVSVLDENPHVMLRIVGTVDIRGPLANYERRIEHYPLQDFLNLQRLIGEVEVNLVPLRDNVFTNSKSNLKYFEAGIVGVPTIASPVFSYLDAIKNGKNGYLAKSYEWYRAINTFIANLNAYNIVADQVYQASQDVYAWYNYSTIIERTLFGNVDSL